MSSTLQGRGADALLQLRARTKGVSDIVPLTLEDDFEISSQTIWLPIKAGGALLADSVTTGVRYDRTAAHIASGGLDLYQISQCLEGEMAFSSGRRELTVRAGDICLLDMAQPSRTILIEGADRRCRLRALMVLRSVLAPRLAHPDSVTALLLCRGDRQAESPLAYRYAALWRLAENEGGDPVAPIEALADLVADAVGSAADTDGSVERADRQLFLAMIKRYIETEPLAADDLCDRFGISRASLYRMFKPEGGLAGYVQEQRLNLAMRRLIAPEGRSERLLDLAINLRFSSDSTFVRAFRRKFGLTPGEVREKSEVWLREEGGPTPPSGILHRLTRR